MIKEDILLFSCYGMRGEGKSYYEKMKEKDKEIERLKNINEEHRILNGKLRVENNTLNNIMNELEEYLNKVIETSSEQERITCSFVLQYLQELKGKINNV